jgi:hypothetical protein
MEEISFSSVRERRGIWLTLSDAETLISHGPNILNEYPTSLGDFIRDEYYRHKGSRFAVEILCDLVAFENLFIDKRALQNWKSSADQLEKVLGPLSKLVKLVEVDAAVYEAAALQAMSYIGKDGQDLSYLEHKFPKNRGGNTYYDGNLEAMLDRMFKDFSFIPSQFVDTQGTVERVLFYANVQRMSGAPVRLSSSHHAALRDYRGALPLSVMEVVEAASALGHVKANVGSHAPEILDAPVPPIFEMIIDKIKGTRSQVSLAQAVLELRDEWEGRCFRQYLWDVQEALSSKDLPKLAYLKNNLLSQIREFDVAGTALTRWTKRISFTLIPGYIFEVPISIRIPRHQEQDYVGFIGRWLGPRAG